MKGNIYWFLGILLLLSCGNGNKLFSKKYLGTYSGVQEAYEITMNGAPIKVPENQYTVVFEYGQLWLNSAQQNVKGTYEVTAETEMYYTLAVSFENGIREEWQLWKKGKQLKRKELAPRPEVIFVK